MAWLQDGVKVNVSLQPASFQSTNDPSILNYEKQFKNTQKTFVYNKYEAEDRPDDPANDPRNFEVNYIYHFYLQTLENGAKRQSCKNLKKIRKIRKNWKIKKKIEKV